MTTKQTPGEAAKAEFLRNYRTDAWDAIAQAAIDAYKAEPKLARARRFGHCTCGQQWQDPECTAVVHD